MMDHLTIIVEPAEDGWFVSTVAEIPGAHSQGRTIKEAIDMALDAANELGLARRDQALEALPPGATVYTLPVQVSGLVASRS